MSVKMLRAWIFLLVLTGGSFCFAGGGDNRYSAEYIDPSFVNPALEKSGMNKISPSFVRFNTISPGLLQPKFQRPENLAAQFVHPDTVQPLFANQGSGIEARTQENLGMKFEKGKRETAYHRRRVAIATRGTSRLGGPTLQLHRAQVQHEFGW